MKRGLIIAATGFVFLTTITSCSNNSGPIIIVAANPVFEDTPVSAAPDTLLAGTSDTTIIIKDGEACVRGRFEAKNHSASFTLPAWKGQKLVAHIKPLQKGGNIRFTHIIQPGGLEEGPFGDSLNYTFKSNGNMRLVVSSNKMAGKPYIGDFLLKISVK
ncbi:MAG: hypothetical protein V4725_04850 [Bacteroidota bacterium]